MQKDDRVAAEGEYSAKKLKLCISIVLCNFWREDEEGKERKPKVKGVD